MECKICGRSIPESIGECILCNDGIPKQKDGIPKQKDGIPQYSKVM